MIGPVSCDPRIQLFCWIIWTDLWTVSSYGDCMLLLIHEEQTDSPIAVATV